MKINTQIIRALNPCEPRFKNYLNYYTEFDGTLEDFILLKHISYSDKVWVITSLFDKRQNAKWGLLCAKKTISIFEEKYLSDNRPRQALDAVEAWLNNPCEETRLLADQASHCAYAAVREAAGDSMGGYSACAAANAAAYAASTAHYHHTANASAEASANAAKDRLKEERDNLMLFLECCE